MKILTDHHCQKHKCPMVETSNGVAFCPKMVINDQFKGKTIRDLTTNGEDVSGLILSDGNLISLKDRQGNPFTTARKSEDFLSKANGMFVVGVLMGYKNGEFDISLVFSRNNQADITDPNNYWLNRLGIFAFESVLEKQSDAIFCK